MQEFPRTAIEPHEILTRLNLGESNDLEFKSARAGIPKKSIWETYSAMANTQGGYILLGIEDDGSVGGLENVRKIKTEFWNEINNRGVVNRNILTDKDATAVEYQGKWVLVINVPKATHSQKPIYAGQDPFRGTYRRNSEGDYHCTDDEVRRMFSDKLDRSADGRVIESLTFDDLDQMSVQQFRQRFSSFHPSHTWLQETDVGLLTKLGGWKSYGKSDEKGLTLAGLLMFGMDEAIRYGCPQYHVDYRERLSDDPEIRWTDRLHFDGTWPGNLFQFYMRIIPKLYADIKVPFQLDSELFRKNETVVHVAIREAVVNALIHSDFRGEGGIVVEKYKDRLEFSNPGSLLVSYEELSRGGISVCRNKSLQLMFSKMGAAEQAGSGVDKIRDGWKSQHWRDPHVRESVQPDRVSWKLPMVSLIPEESLSRLKKRFGKSVSKFDEDEIQALLTVDTEGSVDNPRLRQFINLHTTDATRLLQGLVGKGALIQKGQGRGTLYHFPNDLTSEYVTSDMLHVTSDMLHVTSDMLHVTSDPLLLGQLSENQWDELMEIACLARQNRILPPKASEEIILRLCKDYWLSTRQLSTLMDRNSHSLRTRFLTPMVNHGLLKLRFPDKPRRVDQAYKSIEKSERLESMIDHEIQKTLL